MDAEKSGNECHLKTATDTNCREPSWFEIANSLKHKDLYVITPGHENCKSRPRHVHQTFRHQQGFAIIDLVFTVGIIGLLSGIALPRLMTARNSASSASAIASLRTIGSGQLEFAITCGSGFYAPSLTALARPSMGSLDGFIQGDLGTADTVLKSGYTVTMMGTPFGGAPDTCNALGPGQTAQGYKASADPVDAVNITRFFAINANGVIWEDTAPLFAPMPEAGEPATGHVLLR